MTRAFFAAVSVLVLVCSRAALAADPVVDIPYDHRAINKSVTIPTVLRPGQSFTVRILNTCKTQFSYKMHGVPLAPAQTQTKATGQKPVPQLDAMPLQGTYEAQYGSYLVDIQKTSDAPCYVWTDDRGTPGDVPAEAANDVKFTEDGYSWKPVDLNAVELVIAVTPLEWEIGQDAALTVTPLAIRQWTTGAPVSVATTTTGPDGRPVTTVAQKYPVVRDSQHEDPARFNFATLTHLYAPGRNTGPALGFGLVDNTAEYYFGYAWGLGPRGSRVLNIAAGVVYTPTTSLPFGIQENALIDDPAKLKDLQTNHIFRPFVAITATFFRSTATAGKPQAPPE